MNIVWLIVILTLLGSFIFLVANLLRARTLHQQLRLTESQYTLLFSVCRLRHFIILYVVSVLIYSAGVLYFMYYLLYE